MGSDVGIIDKEIINQLKELILSGIFIFICDWS